MRRLALRCKMYCSSGTSIFKMCFLYTTVFWYRCDVSCFLTELCSFHLSQLISFFFFHCKALCNLFFYARCYMNKVITFMKDCASKRTAGFWALRWAYNRLNAEIYVLCSHALILIMSVLWQNAYKHTLLEVFFVCLFFFSLSLFELVIKDWRKKI